ncbi:MAG: NirD/YgiW/YdeI family stress tolerance protein [Treponema sp.]|jgi:uncharacterized protein (TIGR00156 family)|nr:NirD/YgiW/YdeI family stress tolerance protein [Treponema sp.]
MKRNLLICCILLFGLTGLALSAQEDSQEDSYGYKGPGLDAVTVETAKNLQDDYPVLMRGKIERFLGDEKYLFTDETGNIIVEIDNELWNGISVNQNDMVEITGEVDKELLRVEIDASSIKKI